MSKPPARTKGSEGQRYVRLPAHPLSRQQSFLVQQALNDSTRPAREKARR